MGKVKGIDVRAEGSSPRHALSKSLTIKSLRVSRGSAITFVTSFQTIAFISWWRAWEDLNLRPLRGTEALYPELHTHLNRVSNAQVPEEIDSLIRQAGGGKIE